MMGVTDVALGPDGSLYIADTFNHRVRKVTPQGIITTVAGNGQRYRPEGLEGDGGLATAARVGFPNGLAVAWDGSLYIACGGEQMPDGDYSVVRRVSPQGIITTIPIRFAAGDSTWNNDYPRGLVLGPDNGLYTAMGGASSFERRFVYRVGPALPGDTWETARLASDDKQEVYEFEGDRHTATLSARTGAVLWEFGYDLRGFLSTVTDASNNLLTIERDGSGRPTGIVAPGGQRTTLDVDANGFLSAVSDPSGNGWSFTYTPDGLLTRAEDPNAHASEYLYDTKGLLIQTMDAAGGGLTVSREEIPSGRKITVQTAEGVQTEYATQWFSNYTYQANIGCCGTVWSDIRDTGIITYGAGDGSNSERIMEADPRFGRQTPFLKELHIETPSGRSMTVRRNVEASFDNALDPFSMNQYQEWLYLGDPVSATYRKEYLPEFRREVLTTPMGRTRTTIYDELGRVVRKQRSGLAAVDLVYNSRGRIESIISGEGEEQRVYGFDYSADGRPANVSPIPSAASFRFPETPQAG
jgi:YD repeat-containing protein